MVRLRIGVQLLCFAGFVALTLDPARFHGGEPLFRIDFTSVLGAGLAARTIGPAFVLSVVLMLLTLLFGRVFCGWVCPLGSLGDALDAVFRFPMRGQKLQSTKYVLLAAFATLALFGHTWVWALDPMGWASRLVSTVLPVRVDVVLVAALTLAFFALHVAFGRRAFCRILCPLGAGLGLLARFSRYRRHLDLAKCTHCDLCVDQNRSYAIGPRPEDYDPMECFQCRECDTICPTDALAFEHTPWTRNQRTQPASATRPDVPLARLTNRARKQTSSVASTPQLAGYETVALTRRHWLGGLGAGLAATALLELDRRTAAASDAPVLRPPGSVTETEFLDLCIRCTACMRACPTQTLLPAGLAQGLSGWQAPVLVAREGGCLYECNACGEACPTGAIAVLPLARKQALVLGVAVIDEQRCLPFAKDKPCTSCFGSCPYEAIRLVKTEVRLPWGDALAVPEVDATRCTGCGLCEARCPVDGAAAIRVTAHATQTTLSEQRTALPVFQATPEGLFVLPKDTQR